MRFAVIRGDREAHGAWRDSAASFTEVNRFDGKVRGFEHKESYYDVRRTLAQADRTT